MKKWTEAKKFFLIFYKCITENTSAIWQHAAYTTNLLLLAATQALYKKAYLLKISLEKNSGEWASRKKKDTTESNKTRQQKKKRQEIIKWNHDSPENLDRRATSDIPGLPSGGCPNDPMVKG